MSMNPQIDADDLRLGPIFLPGAAIPITDADEEVFLLYTRLATLKPADSQDTGHFRGLGYVNSKEDILSVRIEINPSTQPLTAPSAKSSGRSRRHHMSVTTKKAEPIAFEYELYQDKTAFRSRNGDTGSVIWKASVDFLQLVLTQRHLPLPAGLFDYTRLSQCHIIELGAGTGLLSVALGPLVRRYTATDTPELVPLLRKNHAHARLAPSVSATALDWTLPADRQLPADVIADPVDLLVVVDCIYHPLLIPPLIDTLSALAVPQHTVVLVVTELRAEDVVRDFLDGWLARGGWKLWRIGGEGEETLLGARYALWIGWKVS